MIIIDQRVKPSIITWIGADRWMRQYYCQLCFALPLQLETQPQSSVRHRSNADASPEHRGATSWWFSEASSSSEIGDCIAFGACDDCRIRHSVPDRFRLRCGTRPLITHDTCIIQVGPVPNRIGLCTLGARGLAKVCSNWTSANMDCARGAKGRQKLSSSERWLIKDIPIWQARCVRRAVFRGGCQPEWWVKPLSNIASAAESGERGRGQTAMARTSVAREAVLFAARNAASGGLSPAHSSTYSKVSELRAMTDRALLMSVVRSAHWCKWPLCV